ncbi:MAG: protein kinase [Thermoanaerobaculia bacterium]
MTLAAGTRLGPYEILAPLGAGGMGEVYKARDARLDRMVAIKVLPRHLSSSDEVRQRFEREAKAISQFSHPHICALHDVGRDGDVDYLVMELLEGDTLAERLAKGPLPLEQTLRYGAQIADALDKAHRQGIVHRDLKPGNIMLTKTGVKLLDFGLAKALPGESSPGLTTSPTQANVTEKGTILGTFQYMAPEQLEGKDADARTDVFALGAVLYEMATGKKAFSGSTQASLISAILRDDPVPISQIQPMSPPTLDRVVKACLAKDPEDRWQSAGDVGKELRWLSEGSASGPASAVARPARPRRALPWAAAALLLLAALFLANELRKAHSARPEPVHSFLLSPEKNAFRLTGDDAAPVTVSPDGDRVVYGAGGRLWVQSLRTATAAALAGTEGARSPFWSPDGRSIAFFSEGKLRRIDAAGGPVTTICDAPNSRGGSWSLSGEIAFTPDIRMGIFRVSAAGGSPQPVTRVDPKIHTTHRWPFFLPDGRHFLYLATNHNVPRSEQSGIYVASLDGGESRRLVSTFGGAQYASGWLLYCADTSLMAVRFDVRSNTTSGDSIRVFDNVHFDSGVWRGNFSASRNGVLAYQVTQAGVGGQLAWLDLAGHVLGKVGEKSEAYSPEISPDGRRAAVVLGDPANDIWICELERGIRSRLTTGAVATPAPVWSPDGSEILVSSQAQRSGAFVLNAVPSDGSGKWREIYSSKERIEPTDWSRDGRHILVTYGNIGGSDIWVVPVADPSKASALVASPAMETSGQFSPDGRWVAYRSSESGRAEVYVTPFPAGGAHWQISGSGATQPRWSPDGRTLYFVSGDGDLVAASLAATGARIEVKETRALFPANFYIGPRVGLTGYAVRPDGKGFLASSAGDVGAPRVALVENWDAELPR